MSAFPAPAPYALPLREHLEEVRQKIEAAETAALFLDFDGTISPIVPVPAKAKLDPGIRATLKELISRPDFFVSIVSGRALADLRERVGLDGVTYVGNHGLEIEDSSIRFREPHAESLRRELRCLLLQLKLALCETEGLEIEDKGLTLAVHFRHVALELHEWVRDMTQSAVSRSRSFACEEGKMVLDVKPAIGWHKGRAVKWIAHEILPPSSLSVYIGDDVTDEDGFAAISDGITIRVGEFTATAAHYFLRDVSAVGEFLIWLHHAKPNALANAQRAGERPTLV